MFHQFFSTPSERMSWFNRARRAGRLGSLNQERVCRALGVLQSKDAQERLAGYQATVSACECPDRHHFPHQACKHMVARMIERRIAEEREHDLNAFLAAVQEIVKRPRWRNGESLWITQTIFVTSGRGEVNLHWLDSGRDYITLALLSIFGGWRSVIDSETIARLTAIWGGQPDPWHGRRFSRTNPVRIH